MSTAGTYPGEGDEGGGPAVAYRATAADHPGAAVLAGVHGGCSTASYGPGTGSAYYPFGGTGTARNFPESDGGGGMTAQTSQRHQDTGAGHQSSCSVMESPGLSRRQPMVSARYVAGCDDNVSSCGGGGGGIYQSSCSQQQQQQAQMMAAAAAGDPNFVCSVWTPENGYASYVIDPRSGATVARWALIL